MNFAELLDIGAARSPAAIAVSQDGVDVTYRDLRGEALSVAGLIEGLSLGSDAKVAVIAHNCLEYPAIVFGAMGAGAVVLPVNPRLAPQEMQYVLADADVEVVFVADELLDRVCALREQLPQLVHVVVIGEARDGVRGYREALAAVDPLEGWRDCADADDCLIVYTSGTTGNPKGAVRSHGSGMWGASNFTSALGEFTPGVDRFLYAIPLASIGFLNVFGACLFAGLTAQLMKQFDPGRALALMERGGVSSGYLVPSMWRMLLRAPELEAADVSGFRTGIWGGEPLDDALRDQIRARFGPVLVGVFGTTEGALVSSRPGDDERYPKTAGRAAGYNVFKVVDDQGSEVPRGTVGELINRGPTVLTRYYKNPEATAATVIDGWYHTGDLATMNDEGFVFIVDRKKEMLISGGQNVYPAEIERALADHPAVAASAVVGVPDDRWGEVPLAFVVLQQEADADTLTGHVRSLLAGYKVPRHWRFVDELPTNANGKVRKHALRAAAHVDGSATT